MHVHNIYHINIEISMKERKRDDDDDDDDEQYIIYIFYEIII